VVTVSKRAAVGEGKAARKAQKRGAVTWCEATWCCAWVPVSANGRGRQVGVRTVSPANHDSAAVPPGVWRW